MEAQAHDPPLPSALRVCHADLHLFLRTTIHCTSGVGMDLLSLVDRYTLADRFMVYLDHDMVYITPWFEPVFHAAEFEGDLRFSRADVRLARYRRWLPVLTRVTRRESLRDLHLMGGVAAVRDYLDSLVVVTS